MPWVEPWIGTIWWTFINWYLSMQNKKSEKQNIAFTSNFVFLSVRFSKNVIILFITGFSEQTWGKLAYNVPVIGAVACVAPAAGNCAYHVLCAVISIC